MGQDGGFDNSLAPQNTDCSLERQGSEVHWAGMTSGSCKAPWVDTCCWASHLVHT